MPLPKVGAEVDLEIGDYNSKIDQVIKSASKADMALNDIGGTVDVKVNVADQDLHAAADMVTDLDSETPTVKISADDTEIDSVNDKLDDIATLGAIDLAINISGTAIGFVESLGRFSGLGGLLEIDNALASIQGRTGQMIPDAENLITDLYTNGWGESRAAIADTIVEATNLKIANEDLGEATLAAFQVQAVTGGETNEILRSMDTLVKNNLVPNYTAAADLITVGFQNGNDRGQDLLDTFNEYGSTFKQVGISGEGALGLINSGLNAGVDNSDRIADAIRETGIRLGEIGTNEDVANAFAQLDDLADIDLAASLDAYNAGEISGDEFFEGFFGALAQANESDPQAAQTIAASLVGTIAEDFGVESISQLTPVWDDTMGTLEGRAETAGNAISNTLSTTVDTFLRGIEQAATDFLSSDQIDLDGKIETLKTQLTTALSTLSSGGSLGDALEIGFGIEGVDTALGNIERVFGQLLIGILEAVAFIQDPTGLGSGDDATRRQIGTLAAQQLPFDLQLANSDEIPGLIDQAFERGVTFENLGTAMRTSIEEAFAGGDFEQGFNIIDGLMASAERNGPEAVASMTEFVSQFTAGLGTAFDEAIASGDFDLAKKIADAQNDPTAYTDALKGVFGFDATAFDQMAAEFTAGMETAIAAENPSATMLWDSLWDPPEEVTTSITDFGTDVDTAMNNASLVTSLASDEMIAALTAMSDAAGLTDEQIAAAMTENTVTASFDAVAASANTNFPIVIQWLNQAADRAANLDRLAGAAAGKLASLGATVVSFPLGQLQAIVNAAAGFAGAQNAVNTTNNTNNNNVTVNNTITNGAQASNVGYEIGREVRGV